ncbi:response regulator [Pseudoflavitalea rhizosphaerae]|uniref:response regulator n=1 Tax=Pseudoflavitalea rhizosphaerae TaxID=1884793 RepID=UPI000F8D4BA4|nr:response regulator [Pseudoflavitalea rhizosphaerae]
MKRILVIEDNRDIRENALEMLELANYEVYAASNGMEGLQIIRSQRPDLILCDIHMPVMDGYSVLENVKKDPSLNEIPVIILSAFSERTEVQKGLQNGASHYIIKPFDDEQLLRVVESFINT